ncbi:hypothetical protein Tco_0642394 [Tanacetum coccineum]
MPDDETLISNKDLHPELPGRDDTIQSISEGKIGIYTLFIEFANFRIPLSKLLLYVLQYYQINFSQLPVLAAAKISHFEIMCRFLGHQPSLGTFHIFYVNSYSNGWFSFSKRGPFSCCVSKNFDSLKNWNNHFFWIDKFVYHIFVPWYKDVSVKRDPLPSDDLVDLPLLDKLNDNRTCIRKYPETFLCLVGLRHSFVDMDARPTLLGRDKNGGCWTLADGEVPLLIETMNMVVAPLDQTVRLVSHTIADEIKEHAGKKKRKVGYSADEMPVKKVRSGGVVILEPNPTTAGKSPATLRRLELQSGQLDVGAGSVPHHIEEFVSSSVTPTSVPEGYEDAGLPHDGNSRTRRASERYVILTSSSKHEDADTIVSPKTTSPKVDYPNPHMQMGVEDVDASVVNETVNTFLPENDVDAASLPGNGVGASSLPKNGVGTSSSAPNDGSPIDYFFECQTIDTATAQDIYVPHWDVTNDA